MIRSRDARAESWGPAEEGANCQALAAGLQHNKTLVNLELAGNAIGAEGTQVLSRRICSFVHCVSFPKSCPVDVLGPSRRFPRVPSHYCVSLLSLFLFPCEII